jgi:hypothetical protein
MSISNFKQYSSELPEDRLARVTQSFVLSKQAGQCPVSTILLSELLKNEQLSYPVPPATTQEQAMTRMLFLADYTLHDYAVRALTLLSFPAHAATLSSIPVLKHRDDLPPAQEVLRETLYAVQHENGSWDGSDRHLIALRIIRSLHGSLYELDGAVVKIPVVMSDLLRTLAVGEHLISTRELVEQVMTLA